MSGSTAAKATFWYTACTVVQKCVGILVVPLYTRMMTGDEYGSYSVFQSWFEVVSVFVTLNLSSYVFNNGMMKYEQDRDGFSSSMVGLSLALSALWIVLFLVAPGFWSDLLGLNAFLVFLLLLRCVATPWYGFWSARLRYEFRYRPVVVSTLAVTILVPAATLPVLYFAEDRLSAALTVQVLTIVLIYTMPLVSIIKRSRRLVDLKYWRFALEFNLPLIPHFLSGTLLHHSDRILISTFCGAAYAGMYSVAYSAAQALTFVHGAVVQALVPWMYEKMRDGAYRRIGQIGALVVGVIGLGSLLLCLLAPEVMMVLAPDEYSGAAYVIPPVAASVMLMTSFNLFVTVEYFFEETKYVMIASVVGAIANILLNIVLLPQFGYLVAGYTTLACYVLYTGGHYVLMRRCMRTHLNLGDVFNWKPLFVVIGVFAASILSTSLLFDYVIVRYVIILIVLLLCGIVCIKNKGKLFRIFGS